MTYQMFLKNKYCRISRIILTSIIGLTLFSCSPQVNVMRSGLKSSPPDTTLSFAEKHTYIGFGAGAETGISFMLPKFSYYNFQNRKSFETYYGIEGSAWIIHAFWTSLNCLYGVKKDSFTFDISTGMWWYPKLKNEDGSEGWGPYFRTTLNPKVGFKFKGVWLKAGPSIPLYRNYSKEQERLGIVDFIKIGNMYYNFEILIKM